MSHSNKYTVKHRRKMEGRTDYKRRLELLKSRIDRLVVRKTNTQLILQIVRYEPNGDKVLITTQSNELKKKGWNYSYKNLSSSYLAGILIARKALSKNIKTAILDVGRQSPLSGSRLFAALKGAIDGGLDIPANEKVFPPQDRLNGKHIASHNNKFKNITSDFDKMKSELMKN